MNIIIEKIKQAFYSPQSISIANIMSGILIYTLDNYMQIGAALSFFATTLIAIITKYNNYKQDKLDRIQAREVEMIKLRIELNILEPIKETNGITK